MNMTIEQVAELAHELNRTYCMMLGDRSRRPWRSAQPDDKRTVIDGVKFSLDNPAAGSEEQHNAWMQDKIDAGWKKAEVKCEEAKHHPCIVPYDDLPDDLKIKDKLFLGVVNAFRDQFIIPETMNETVSAPADDEVADEAAVDTEATTSSSEDPTDQPPFKFDD